MRVIDLLEDAEVEEEIITISEDVVITRDGEEIFRGGRGGRGRRDEDKRQDRGRGNGPPQDPPGQGGGGPPQDPPGQGGGGPPGNRPARHGPPHAPPGKRPEPGDIVTREQTRTRTARKVEYPKGSVVKVTDASAAQLVSEGKAVYRI